MNEQISIFLLLYLLIIIAYYFFRSKISLYQIILINLLLVFSVTRFHPQWIIWLMPFLTLAYGEKIVNLKYIIPFTITYFVYFILFGDSFLTTGLLSPISNLYLEIPSFTKIVPENYQSLISTSTQSLFAIASMTLVIKLLMSKVSHK